MSTSSRKSSYVTPMDIEVAPLIWKSPPFYHELIVSYDWWSVYMGLFWIALATWVVAMNNTIASPEPKGWGGSEAGDSFPVDAIVGMIIIFPLILFTTRLKDFVIKRRKSMYHVPDVKSPLTTQPDEVKMPEGGEADHDPLILGETANSGIEMTFVSAPKPKRRVARTPGDPMSVSFTYYASSLFFSYIMSLLSLWLGRERGLYDYGFGYAFWSVFIGMAISNVLLRLRKYAMVDWILICHKSGYFVKVALVLLGLRLQTIVALGGPGILVSWAVTPIVIVVTYYVGVRWMKFGDARPLAMTLAVGLAVCGPSAATATAEVIGATQHELALVIALMTIVTVLSMVIMPAVANYTGMDDLVAGAWFGGTIDETAAVAAAASNVSRRAEEAAVTVKIIQNAQLGFVVVGVSIYWILRMPDAQRSGRKKSFLRILWDNFPKFIIGFMIASVYYSIVLDNVMARNDVDLVLEFAKAGNHWYFCLFFIGIGLKVDLVAMWVDLRESYILPLYLFGQGFDLIITYAVAVLVFTGVFLPVPDI